MSLSPIHTQRLRCVAVAVFFILELSVLGVEPPVLDLYPSQTGIQGQPFQGSPPAVNALARPVQWSLANAPSGMTLDSVTGAPQWLHPASGTFYIVLRVTNSAGGDAVEWALNIVATNGYPELRLVSSRCVDFVVPDYYAAWLQGIEPRHLVDEEYDRLRRLTGVETTQGKQVVFLNTDLGGSAWSGQPVSMGPGWLTDPWTCVANLMIHEVGHNFNDVMGMPGGYFGWFNDFFHHGTELLEQPILDSCAAAGPALGLTHEARAGFLGHIQGVEASSESRYSNYLGWLAGGGRATNYTADPYGAWAGLCQRLRHLYGPAMLDKTARAWRHDGLSDQLRNHLADTDAKRLTLLFCVMSAAAGTDLRPCFLTNGFDIDDTFYAQASNEVFTTVANLPYEDVGEGWKQCPLNNHYYKLTGWSTSWEFAERAARGQGGHLVTVRNAGEEQWLESRFGYSRPLWLGFTDAGHEGGWKWSSGEPVTYQKWNSGEPNGGTGENYAVIWYETGEWVDVGPSRFRGIIEVTNPPVVAAAPEVWVVTMNSTLRESSAQPGQFRLVSTTNGPLQVELQLGGTATEGLDYAALSHTVFIPAGTNEATVLLQPLQDGLAEGPEDILLTVTNPLGTTWPCRRGRMVLLDDDYPAGAIKREVWTNLDYSGSLSSLTNHPRYPNSPDWVEYLQVLEPAYLTGDWADAYGQRLSGYLVAPASGNYVFYLASDDNSELWLSTDANPAHRHLLASVPGYTAFRHFFDFSSQASAPVFLEQNQWYYLEVLHKEGWGGDHLSVTWTPPGGAPPVIGSAPIPAACFAASYPTAWPRSVLTLYRTGSQDLRLHLESLASVRNVLQVSEDLLTWTSVSTNQPGADLLLSSIDPASTNRPQRFYRAVLLLP